MPAPLPPTPPDARLSSAWLRRKHAGSLVAGRGLLLGALSAALWGGIGALGWLDSGQNLLQDSFFRLRSARYGASSIVLVTVDDATVERAGPFPLPRRWHARVVDELSRAGAKTIAFDILFADASASRPDDLALQAACARAGNVVQAVVFWVGSSRRFDAPPAPASRARLPAKFRVREDERERAVCASSLQVTAPQPALERSAVALGHLNASPESDGVQRRQAPLIRYAGQVYPSLPVAAAAHFLGLNPAQVSAHGRQVLVGSRRLDVDGEGKVGINWVGGHRAFPTYSYLDVLGGRVPREVLRGKLVLVGTAAAGSYDQRATPIAAQTGLDVQANALSDILLGSSLRPLSPWLDALLLLALPCALGALVATWGQARSLAVGALALLGALALSWAALAQGYVWPVATPLCAMATALALVGASNYKRVWEASLRSQVGVETLARGGSLLSSATQFSQASASHRLGTSCVPEAARSEVARVAAETLGQAVGSPLVLWLRDGASPVVAASPHAWMLATHPLDDAACQALRALAAHAASLPEARVEPLKEAAREDASEPVRAAALAVRAASELSAQAARLGRQVLVAPLRREAGAQAGAAEVMVAFAPRHASWGANEEVLARAVVEQSLLALANLEFTHALSGRVEAADRDLREAYGVVFEQSTKLSAALEGIDDALLITDRDGRLLYANAATRPVLRQAAPDVGQLLPQVLQEHGLDALARSFEDLASVGEDERVRAEATLRVQEGEVEATRVLASQVVTMRDIDGQPVGALLIVSDATAERQIDRMKTDFVAYVAHELRTPLTTVLGYASLLQQMGAGMDEAQRQQMSGVIIQHCQRLNRMISELLDTAALDSGGTLALRLEPIDLAKLAERLAEEQSRARASHAGLCIVFEAPVRPLIAEADADRVEQVLTNLLSNAIKYSPHGGCVRVQVLASEDGSEAVLHIRDEGMGMTPEQLGRLFSKFYRTPDAHKSGIKGTGLGLFLVKQLVQAHSGRIEVQSEIGVGTSFSVFLPRQHAQRHREWTLDGAHPGERRGEARDGV